MHQEGEGQAEAIFPGRSGGHIELARNEGRVLCGLCPDGCWVVAGYDENGNLSSVRADESSPLGMLCKLGEHSPEIVYSPNRLRTPHDARTPIVNQKQ